MITKQKYVEYLLSTPTNYTCTNLAEHLEGVSHDVVSDLSRAANPLCQDRCRLPQGDCV